MSNPIQPWSNLMKRINEAAAAMLYSARLYLCREHTMHTPEFEHAVRILFIHEYQLMDEFSQEAV